MHVSKVSPRGRETSPPCLPYCIQMWRRFPEVISFDNAYNTNRFKLPLFQVTGQTCLGTVFNAAFGLIDNERFERFQFVTNGVCTLFDRYSIRTPDVVITDFDDQMKKALRVEFQDAQQQLCIHHINSNVIVQSKRKWGHSYRLAIKSASILTATRILVSLLGP